MYVSQLERTLKLVRDEGILRPRDLDRYGIPREYLQILFRTGKIRRSGRGLYSVTTAEASEHHTIAEACKRVPNGVICLISALRMYDMTTQLPPEIWMAINRKDWKPKVDYPPLRIVRFSGRSRIAGIETREVEGVQVKVYGPAKTVADCFKYRNKIGIDIAIEALRNCWRRRLATMDELWRAAKICRVANVMRPYMESLV